MHLNNRKYIYIELGLFVLIVYMCHTSISSFQEYIEEIYKRERSSSRVDIIFQIAFNCQIIGDMITLTYHVFVWKADIVWRFKGAVIMIVASMCIVTLYCFCSWIVKYTYIVPVFVAYLMMGFGIGVVKSNIWPAANSLSKATKIFSVIMISPGVIFIKTICYILIKCCLNIRYIFLAIVTLICISSLLLYIRVYETLYRHMALNNVSDSEQEEFNLSVEKYLAINTKPQKIQAEYAYVIVIFKSIFRLCILNIISGLLLSLCDTRTLLYLYPYQKVVFYTNPKLSLSIDIYICIYNICLYGFIVVGKLFVFKTEIYSLCIPLCCFLLSILMFVMYIPELTFVSAVFLGFASGTFYMQCIGIIEVHVEPNKESVAFALWFIFANIGVIIGSNTAYSIAQYMIQIKAIL